MTSEKNASVFERKNTDTYICRQFVAQKCGNTCATIISKLHGFSGFQLMLNQRCHYSTIVPDLGTMYALVVIWYTLEFMVCIIAMILHAESFGQNVDYRWKINGSNMSLDLYEKCPVFRKQLCILVRFGQIWYRLF